MCTIRSVAMAIAVGMVGATAALAQGDAYPSRCITVICAYGAGGGGDAMVRYFAERLSKLSGQPVVVQNKVGASGNLGTQAAAQSKPDGYTLLIHTSSAMNANPRMMKDAGYDPVKDFTPVTTLSQVGFVLVVRSDSPINDVANLTAFAKSRGGKAKYGVSNTSSLASSEFYRVMTGVEATRVNYKAATEVISDIVYGDIDFAFVDSLLAIPQARAGRVKAIAVTNPTRIVSAPEIPTVAESGLPQYQYISFWAAWLPANAPRDVTAKLEGWLNQIVSSDESKAYLATLGSEPMVGSAAILASAMKADSELWAKIVAFTNMQPE